MSQFLNNIQPQQPQSQPQIQPQTQSVYDNPIFSPTKEDVIQDLNIPINVLEKPNFESTIQTGQVGEKVVSYMESKAKYIDIMLLEPGQHFDGLAWCLNSVVVANKMDFRTFDITMTLIDIKGRQFTAKKWGITKSEVLKDTPVYISGAVMYFNDSTTKRFRIDEYTHYNVSLPRSLFLKSIDKLESEKELFFSNLNKLSELNTPAPIKAFLNSILITYHYGDNLKTSTYKSMIGTKLGCKFSVVNKAINMIESLTELNEKDSEFKMTTIIMLFMYIINLQMTQELYQDENTLASSMTLNLMRNDFSFDEKSASILSKCFLFMSNRYNRYNIEAEPEAYFLQSILNTIDNALRVQ